MARTEQLIIDRGRELAVPLASLESSHAWPALIAIGIGAILLLGGCSKGPVNKPVFPVSGQVVLDGKPVPYASITLFAQNVDGATERPNAVADKNGKFSLTTYSRDDGAPAGNYVAVVEARKQIVKNGDSDFGDNYLPARYGNAQSSDLKIEVRPEPNELALKLRR